MIAIHMLKLGDTIAQIIFWNCLKDCVILSDRKKTNIVPIYKNVLNSS